MLTELTGVVLCRDAALCSKESEDEVRRWREERKRNYPTTSNVKRKVAVSSFVANSFVVVTFVETVGCIALCFTLTLKFVFVFITLVLYTCVQAEDRQGRKARGELMDEDARLRRQVTLMLHLCVMK
jgi:hypothetical protein